MNLSRICFSPEHKSGSLQPRSEPEFLVVGKLRKPHGLRGEIIMSVWTDFPERLIPGAQLLIGETQQPCRIAAVRPHRQDLLIAFEGYSDRDQVGVFRNQLVYVRADDRPALAEGEYYLHQLLGLQVIEIETERPLGVVEKVIETGANDVLLVRTPAGDEILLPDIDAVVKDIDLEKKELQVTLLPGLLP